MWKNYINIISKRDINYTHKQYCIWFAQQFSYNISSLQDFSNSLEIENGDLLPISKNLLDHFNHYNVEAILNFIYHLNELDIIDFIIMKPNKSSNIHYVFNYQQKSSYFGNVFSFDTEILLNNDNNLASLLFLFLFFLPQHHYKDSLYHCRKDIPLISCNKITFNHFEMLLFLMKNYDKNNFSLLCNDYNLNLFLLEDFCQTAQNLYTFINKEDWYTILPLEKIKVLYKEKCLLHDFINFRTKKFYYTVPTLADFITYFQKEMEFLNLKQKLTSKGQSRKKEKVIKI